MQDTNPSPIVGVFRDHAKADRAVEELKQAGFDEDQITSATYSMESAQGAQTPENSRVIVTVKAESMEQQAFGILFKNGANNADLPAGMILKHGKIVNSQAETVDLIPQPELEANFTGDSYFGEVKVPGLSEEPGMLDTH
jgi:hypothetical protein